MTNAAPPASTPGSATEPAISPLATRFRGFLPVVVDVETGGFDWNRNALLEIAVLPLDVDENGLLVLGVLAHSAVYDTERTAELFCKIVNAWPSPMPGVAPLARVPTPR